LESNEIIVGAILTPSSDQITFYKEGYGNLFVRDVFNPNAIIQEYNGSSVKLKSVDSNIKWNNGNYHSISEETALRHFKLLAPTITIKFNVGDSINPISVEDMLLSGHTTEFMLDARECNFIIYGMDLSGEIKLIRADNKPLKNKSQNYTCRIDQINNCFELVSSIKQKTSRLDLIE
jgi:hypothetical protein